MFFLNWNFKSIFSMFENDSSSDDEDELENDGLLEVLWILASFDSTQGSK